MAVKRRMSVAEIVQAWEGGLLARGQVPERLLMIINEENIDEVIASLTPEVRDDFIETAATHYAVVGLFASPMAGITRPRWSKRPTTEY